MDVKKIDWIEAPGYLFNTRHDVEIVQGVDRRWRARTIADGMPIGPRVRSAAAACDLAQCWIAANRELAS